MYIYISYIVDRIMPTYSNPFIIIYQVFLKLHNWCSAMDGFCQWGNSRLSSISLS